MLFLPLVHGLKNNTVSSKCARAHFSDYVFLCAILRYHPKIMIIKMIIITIIIMLVMIIISMIIDNYNRINDNE